MHAFLILYTGEAGCCFQAWDRTFRRLFYSAVGAHISSLASPVFCTIESIRKLPNASERFRAHSNVSERMWEGPNRSKHVSESTKTSTNSRKLCESRVRAVVVSVSSMTCLCLRMLVSDPPAPWAYHLASSGVSPVIGRNLATFNLALLFWQN